MSTKQLPRFDRTACSHCGGKFGPGDAGFSHCDQHAGHKVLSDLYLSGEITWGEYREKFEESQTSRAVIEKSNREHAMIHHKSVIVTLCGVEIICTGVIFYPYEPATVMDPPIPPEVEWDEVYIASVNVTELFHGSIGRDLEEAIIKHLEQ